MKRSKPRSKNYPVADDLATRVRESAAAYGLRRDLMGVREAKDQFSDIIKRAAAGEEIVIASDGVPTAMIVAYRPTLEGKPFRPNWKLLNSLPMTPDSTPQIRAERDSRP